MHRLRGELAEGGPCLRHCFPGHRRAALQEVPAEVQGLEQEGQPAQVLLIQERVVQVFPRQEADWAPVPAQKASVQAQGWVPQPVAGAQVWGVAWAPVLVGAAVPEEAVPLALVEGGAPLGVYP